MPQNESTALETLRLEFARYRRRSLVAQCLGAALLLGAWTAGQRGTAPSQAQVLRVRGIIVEDSLGRPRIVIGAPLTLPGRTAAQSGDGIAVLSPTGALQTALGAPTPAPMINGTVVNRVGGSAGFVIADPDGNERGGMGAFPDGRANVCLDYAKGVKEAACLVTFANDQMAGLVVNGLPGEKAFDRVTALVGKGGWAQMKISAPTGQESAILRSTGTDRAQLMVYDSATKSYKDVLPRE
ncbi:MAG TPA: hypothetical protein VGE27_12580 [Gemmatimonas sp.]|uniref:hypothetical protein n=1 Tax=Gemmatimonas sp. TaxID=1962908 RepID=UPI002ED8CB0F